MSATVTATASDRSDFRTVMVGGTQIGVLTAVAVVAFLIVSRQVPAGGAPRGPQEPGVPPAGAPRGAFPPPPPPAPPPPGPCWAAPPRAWGRGAFSPHATS